VRNVAGSRLPTATFWISWFHSGLKNARMSLIIIVARWLNMDWTVDPCSIIGVQVQRNTRIIQTIHCLGHSFPKARSFALILPFLRCSLVISIFPSNTIFFSLFLSSLSLSSILLFISLSCSDSASERILFTSDRGGKINQFVSETVYFVFLTWSD
jgi:hypothetical protein